MGSIFRLKHISKGREDYGYPEFPVSISEYLFLTFEDAKNEISKIVNEPPKWYYHETICFLIEQLEVGIQERKDDGNVWLFDGEGQLQDQSFNKGDIVEVLDLGRNEKSVHLGIVADDNYVVSGIGYCSGDSGKLIMKPRYEVPDDVREFLNYCLEHLGHKDEPAKYKCDIFDDQTHNSIDYTLLCPYYDKELGRYVFRLGWENYKEDYSDTILPGNLSEEELNGLRSWLGEMKYGKTRLWYILREFHFYQDEENPPLSLDLTFDELVYGKTEH